MTENSGEDSKLITVLNRFRARLPVVRVDAIGVGHNFALHLRDHRFRVDMVNVAMQCESKRQRSVNDPAQRFVNLKACCYTTLADAFELDQGLTDEETIGQLSGILYEIDAHGRMEIESKEKARECGASSPDRAEALMLALCKPPPEYGYRSARDLPRQRPRGADTETGGLLYSMASRRLATTTYADVPNITASLWRFRRRDGDC